MKNYLTTSFLLTFFTLFAQQLTFDKMEGKGEFFEVKNGELHLNAPAESSKKQWIYPFFKSNEVEWKTTIDLSFLPSSSNAVDWYLISSTENLQESSGYLIHWGMSGADVLQFYKQIDGKKTKIAEGQTILALGGEIHLTVTKNQLGEWKVYLNDQLEISFFDNEQIDNQCIGFLCTYTKSNSKGFSFDNISLTDFVDSTIVLLTDSLHDVVFSEILIDEEPSVFLPKSEFIELYNRSEKAIQLKNWILLVDDQQIILDSFLFLPHTYLVLFPQKNKEQLLEKIPALFCESWEKLNNQEGEIMLKNSQGKLIDSFTYDEKLLSQHAKKSLGGWSLERKDLDFFCDEKYNWFYSTSLKGGTPIAKNSIEGKVIDDEKPSLEKMFIYQNKDLVFTFDEKIDTTYFTSSLIDTFIIDKKIVHLFFKNSLDDLSQDQLKIDFLDCSNNILSKEVIIALPQKALKNDVIITEILPDPFEGGTEFIELYNNSDKIIDLSDLWIGMLDEERLWKQKVQLPQTLFSPSTYYVFTNQKEGVINFYDVAFPQQVYEVNLPILTNESGTIVLANSEGEILEEFSYTENQHYRFLADEKGVSLERISLELSANDFENWTSASEQINWGSPTTKNSQTIPTNLFDFELTTQIITPNGDGIEDELQIQYAFDDENWMGTFTIFNRNAHKIITFDKHKNLGKQGLVHWDITNDNGQLISVGFYVLMIELYNDKGEIKVIKLPFSVAN